MDLYTYKVKLVKVYDGDTIRASLDLGFSIDFGGVDGKGHSFRLARINTPEIRGEEREEGLKSKEALVEILEGKDILLKSVKKPDKYGRYIAELFIEDADEWVNVNDLLVHQGFAEYL